MPTPQELQMNPSELAGGQAGQDAYNTRIGSLQGTMTGDTGNTGGGDLTNLQSALREALNEATQKKAEDRIKSVSPLMEGGAAPSVFTAALGLAKQGLQTSEDTKFHDIVTGYTEQEKMKQTKTAAVWNQVNTMMDNKSLGEMPDAALLAMEKEGGLSAGTMLAIKARAKILEKQGDEKAAVELKDLQAQIKQRNDSLSGNTQGGSSFNDILQNAIDSGASPEEAARAAAIVSENLGIPVNQKTLEKFTTTATSLKKTPAKSAGGSSGANGASPIYPKGSSSASVISLDDMIKQLTPVYTQNSGIGSGMVSHNALKTQLIKEGYPADEVTKRQGDVFEKIEQGANSFFGRLFGGQ